MFDRSANAAGACSSLQTGKDGPRIVASGLGKKFGDLQVFRDVHVEAGEDEILCVVGPSGCGKTTFLRCVDGLLPFDEGELFIENEPVTGPRDRIHGSR